MKRTVSHLFSLLMTVVMVASCVREKQDMRHLRGNEVVFGASTTYQNGSETRTTYSGEFSVTGGSQYERIDWVTASDVIRVVCKQGSDAPLLDKTASDYRFRGSATTAGQKSQAEIEPATKNGIQWGEGMHHFFAMYPAPGMTSEYGKTESSASIVVDGDEHAKISGKVGSSQEYVAYKTYTKGGVSYKEYKPDMNGSYMYAVANAKANLSAQTVEPDPVTLSFKPLVTVFELSFKAGDDMAKNFSLKSVETFGAEVDQKFDYGFTTEDAFNHRWEE